MALLRADVELKAAGVKQLDPGIERLPRTERSAIVTRWSAGGAWRPNLGSQALSGVAPDVGCSADTLPSIVAPCAQFVEFKYGPTSPAIAGQRCLVLARRLH
jgi:hypothetical protein